MKRIGCLSIGVLLLAVGSLFSQEKLVVDGLEKPVRILVDQWGVPHIYAETESDLFFAQGFYAARDRLFQFEIWRMQATGTTAEVFGSRELKRDIGARLFKFRGDIQSEMQHYHPRGGQIITAFVAGVNAYIEQTRRNPAWLPEEFRMLGIKPGFWTPEIVVSRHQGLLGNIATELSTARAVMHVGAETVKALSWFHPHDPDLVLDTLISSTLLQQDILEVYNAFRKPLSIKPEDLVAHAESRSETYVRRAAQDEKQWMADQRIGKEVIGSNNWIVSGSKTQSGYPILANDPHRALSAPSLRYMAHLVAPGWDVIGGGEPVIPGISIGHNPFGAWGLTIFSTDAEDLYVYQTHPDRPDEYLYQGKWEAMELVYDTIRIKGKAPEVCTLRYTRHGPVVFQDTTVNRACAVRCGWLETGGAPYLASLRMNQARSWEEFRQACQYSHIPGENMIWADPKGNIGWQAVGIAPIRRNWSGMVPVPGDGRFEWDKFLPIQERPSSLNPASGYFTSANENVTPIGYSYPEALGFSWSDPYRGDRAAEFLESGRKFTIQDMAELQTDYLSLPARQLVPLLKNLTAGNTLAEQARLRLLDWDFQLETESVAATIYNAWEGTLRDLLEKKLVPVAVQPYLNFQMKQVVEHIQLPDGRFGPNAVADRNALLISALEQAVAELERALGKQLNTWKYGMVKHVLIKHPMSNAMSESQRKKFEVGPFPRGGNASTVNNTGAGLNQSHGATFRIIMDTANWDHTLATNSPGQSGDVHHPNYRNLFELWAIDQFFPLFYSPKKIESVTSTRLLLVPTP